MAKQMSNRTSSCYRKNVFRPSWGLTSQAHGVNLITAGGDREGGSGGVLRLLNVVGISVKSCDEIIPLFSCLF